MELTEIIHSLCQPDFGPFDAETSADGGARNAMSWIEMIRITFGVSNRGFEDFEILSSLSQELDSVESLEWEIFRSRAVREDILLVLRWKGEPPKSQESDLAQALSNELRREGLVYHSSWVTDSDR